MKILSTKKLIGFLFLFLSTSLFGQGIMRGVVNDSLTQKPLVGANVFIFGTALGSASDLDGNYRITGIPAGTHKVKISYIGYRSKEITIDIQNNKTLQLDIDLAPDVIEGQTVVVTGQAIGQTAAINQQLSANTILNVVSEEKIQQLPDANAAEALGRLPGISIERSGGEANKIILRGLDEKFSTITIDGLRIASTDADARGVDLSTISQGSLAGIELFKAITSDKDGDAIAGSVNLVTRKAPAKRSLSLESKGIYDKLDNSVNQYDFNLKYGERFFHNILGVQASGNLEQRIRSNEATDLNYDQSLNNYTDYRVTNSTLNYTNELRKRGGFSLLLDLNTPDSGSVKLNTIYNKTSRDYITYNRNYPSFTGNPILYGARDQQQDISTFNSFLTGDNYLFGLTINWGAAFAQSKSENPYDYQMDFTEPSILDSTGQPISGMRAIPSSVQHGPIEAIIPYAINNFNKAYLYDAYNRYAKNLDIENTIYLNISKKYNLSNTLTGEIKFGGKYRVNRRSKENYEYLAPYYLYGVYGYQKLPDGSIVKKDYSGTQFANMQLSGNSILVTNFLNASPETRNIYNLYSLNPMINRSDLEEWRTLNINGVKNPQDNTPEYGRNSAQDANYYDITERISAGYLMNTFNFGNLVTFIAGVRVEKENNDYKTKYSPDILSGFPTPTGPIRDTTSTHQETVWLPNFQLLYKPLDFLNVRFAAYRALARPDFNRRLASYILRQAGTFYSDNSITVGNPELRDAKAWNYEVNTSFYGNYIGLFSISAFYKEITDMFHTVDGIRLAKANGQQILDSLGIPVTNPFVTDFDITYQYNSRRPTKVWGFEVEHQINMWFLPGFLKNFVLSYNFSIIRSETYITSSTTRTEYVYVGPVRIPKTVSVLIDSKQKLEGQPDFFGNISLGYDISGFSARASVFHQGQYNQSFSFDGRSDVVVDAFTRVDLILKQQISNHLSISLSLSNLTNVQEGTSIVNRVEGWTLANTNERYGLTADLGVKISL